MTAQPSPLESNNDFYACLDRGFECLKRKDRPGALAHWSKASELRPRDRRIQSNLRQLERLVARQSAKMSAPQ